MKYFENELSYNQITFYMSNTLSLAEREMHSYHEILYYIEGDAELLTEMGQQTLMPNDLIIIPKECYHFFRLNEAENFTRLKISVPDSVIHELSLRHLFSEITIIQNSRETIFFVLNRLHQLLTQLPSKNTSFHAHSFLMMLLSELDIADISKFNTFEVKNDSFLPEVLAYITQNLSGDLSIESLAKQNNLSTSTLSHTFKKELGISLHEYIKQRRLIHAKGLINRNHKPSKIYLECGFQDYSSFYKAYLKYFGYPPSKEGK